MMASMDAMTVKVETFPIVEALHGALLRVAAHEDRLEGLAFREAARKAHIAALVAEAKDADNKPRFTSEDKRKSAAADLEAQDVELNEIRRLMADEKLGRASALATAEACRYTIRLTVATLTAAGQEA